MPHTKRWPAPSTEWREQIAPDEAQRFAGYAKRFAQMQKDRSAVFGAGRALHRKQITAAQGTLEVLDGLPDYCRHGLFETPGIHEVWIRLSNGSFDRASDKIPDIRGFALRVMGVSGPAALGNGDTHCQDFSLINQEKFAFAGSDEFVEFVLAAARGKLALLKYVVGRYGLLGGPQQVAKLLKSSAKPFTGFASESMFSAVPVACGPYAIRLRLTPDPANQQVIPLATSSWSEDFDSRLAQQALHWELQVQHYVNDTLTPIEDASVNWPTPYVTVARLMLPVQRADTREARQIHEHAESGTFDPWQALAEHRPLGDVQRARKVIYYASQRGRGAA